MITNCININKDFAWIESIIPEYDTDNKAEICISYISEFESAKTLRDCMWKICDDICIDFKWKSRLVLIIDELNNNAIEYGSKRGELNKMYVKIEKRDKEVNLIVEVEDTWNWEKAKTAEQMEELRSHKLSVGFDNHNSIRWRWLFLITERMVDQLYFQNSMNWWLIVWIKKLIKTRD